MSLSAPRLSTALIRERATYWPLVCRSGANNLDRIRVLRRNSGDGGHRSLEMLLKSRIQIMREVRHETQQRLHGKGICALNNGPTSREKFVKVVERLRSRHSCNDLPKYVSVSSESSSRSSTALDVVRPKSSAIKKMFKKVNQRIDCGGGPCQSALLRTPSRPVLPVALGLHHRSTFQPTEISGNIVWPFYSKNSH
ncbi:hypothetical protein KC345_g140 [Hortaea werneckii]|nr:hypothetical protein KC345_g140 [Hortaea werneckii]